MTEPILRFGAFTESLHPRAAGKFAKKGQAAPAKKTTASGGGKSAASGSKGNLSFNGRHGAGYGTPGGDKRVHSLQQALNRLGFRDGAGKSLKDDGKLGPKTTAAIKRAQRALGLKPDGVVTPALLTKLTKAKSAKDLKAPAKKVAAKKVPTFTKPAKKAAPAKAPVTVHRSTLPSYSGRMTEASRHLPGKHNQQSHANRVGRPLIPSKTGLGSKAHLARKGTHKPHVGDEVELAPHPDGRGSSYPKHLTGKVGRLESFLGEGGGDGESQVEFPDGSTMQVRAYNLKVRRTAEELDKEDSAKETVPGYYGFYPDEHKKRNAKPEAPAREFTPEDVHTILKDGDHYQVHSRPAHAHKAILVKAGATPEQADQILKDLGVADPDSHLTADIGSIAFLKADRFKKDKQAHDRAAAAAAATPAAFARLLGTDGKPPLIKSKPVTKVFEAMQASGWLITSASGHGGYTFSSADGTRSLNILTINGVTLYDDRHNKISGVKALAVVNGA